MDFRDADGAPFPAWHDAAPEVWVELSAVDAERLGLGDGELAEITTPRGAVRARVRVGGIRDGTVQVGGRHHVEHEVHHVARDLARWSRDHVHSIADAGARYGLDADPRETSGLLAPVRTKLGDMTGRVAVPGLLLLADLRRLHRKVAEMSLDWELVAQVLASQVSRGRRGVCPGHDDSSP